MTWKFKSPISVWN